MAEETITTGVDELLDLLKTIEKIPLTDAAKKLKIGPSLLQSWVDFLVEEEIVGIEYNFTKPIIYLNKAPEEKKVKIQEDEGAGIETYKKDFNDRAKIKNIPQEKLNFLWKNHVSASLNRKREFFFREAKKRNLSNAETLWRNYREKLFAS